MYMQFCCIYKLIKYLCKNCSVCCLVTDVLCIMYYAQRNAQSCHRTRNFLFARLTPTLRYQVTEWMNRIEQTLSLIIGFKLCFYRAMHYSAKRSIAIACRSSVWKYTIYADIHGSSIAEEASSSISVMITFKFWTWVLSTWIIAYS